MSTEAMAELTPELAWRLLNDSSAFFALRPKHGSLPDELWDHVLDLASALEASALATSAENMAAHRWPRRMGHRPPGRRTDVEELRDFVAMAARLPRRELQVFDACIVRGLTLAAAAAELGIGRGTVRTHLDSLRTRARRARS